jgi:opacity protein-like surface antigen
MVRFLFGKIYLEGDVPHMTKPIVLLLVLMLLAVSVWAEDEAEPEAEEDEKPYAKNYEKYNYVFVGLAPAPIDTAQFDEDLKFLGVQNYDMPTEARIGIGGVGFIGNHMITTRGQFDLTELRNHEAAHQATLNYWQYTIRFGYGYRFNDWLEARTDLGLGFFHWRYTLISGTSAKNAVNGSARGSKWAFQPEAGVMLHTPWKWSFYFFGGYDMLWGSFGGELYTGDFTRDDFNAIDFDHPLFGVDWLFRF